MIHHRRAATEGAEVRASSRQLQRTIEGSSLDEAEWRYRMILLEELRRSQREGNRG